MQKQNNKNNKVDKICKTKTKQNFVFLQKNYNMILRLFIIFCHMIHEKVIFLHLVCKILSYKRKINIFLNINIHDNAINIQQLIFLLHLINFTASYSIKLIVLPWH